MDENTRAASVAHCKWADSVICPAPWILDEAFLTRHEIDFVAHDAAPYASADGSDCYALVKQKGMFLATDRTDGISTSDIIVQIVKDCTSLAAKSTPHSFVCEPLIY
jgi:choline-phosphate cytidylyltransferase